MNHSLLVRNISQNRKCDQGRSGLAPVPVRAQLLPYSLLIMRDWCLVLSLAESSGDGSCSF